MQLSHVAWFNIDKYFPRFSYFAILIFCKIWQIFPILHSGPCDNNYFINGSRKLFQPLINNLSVLNYFLESKISWLWIGSSKKFCACLSAQRILHINKLLCVCVCVCVCVCLLSVSGFSFPDTDNTNDNKIKEGTISISCYHFHSLTNIETFICLYSSWMSSSYF